MLEIASKSSTPSVRVDVYVPQMRMTRTYDYDLNRMQQRYVSSGVSRADLNDSKATA